VPITVHHDKAACGVDESNYWGYNSRWLRPAQRLLFFGQARQTGEGIQAMVKAAAQGGHQAILRRDYAAEATTGFALWRH